MSGESKAWIQVECVTKLKQHGADPEIKEVDVLRPPSLKGVLRFWTRALIRVDDESHRGLVQLRKIETAMWGSTETGQGIRLVGVPRMENKQATIVFRVPDPKQMERLRAVVWIWLQLGGIGGRSRRGHGSFQWLPTHDDLLTGHYPPYPNLEGNETKGPKMLCEYLETGLRKALAAFGHDEDQLEKDRESHRWFRLNSLDQVFVGQTLDDDRQKKALEGFGGRKKQRIRDNEYRYSDQMGKAKGGRLASPMLWHLHECGQSTIPVMTWSPWKGVTRLRSGDPMSTYLTQKLGFRLSLVGTPLIEE